MNDKPSKWWETNTDEVIIGVCISLVSIVSVIVLGKDGAMVATAGIGALGVYLGSKTKAN